MQLPVLHSDQWEANRAKAREDDSAHAASILREARAWKDEDKGGEPSSDAAAATTTTAVHEAEQQTQQPAPPPFEHERGALPVVSSKNNEDIPEGLPQQQRPLGGNGPGSLNSDREQGEDRNGCSQGSGGATMTSISTANALTGKPPDRNEPRLPSRRLETNNTATGISGFGDRDQAGGKGEGGVMGRDPQDPSLPVDRVKLATRSRCT